jgi:hypothetical protein
MKNLLIFCISILFIKSYSQINLPIDFEDGVVTTENLINFNGGTGSVIDNPFVDESNSSNKVGKIVRDGGDIWAGSYIELDNYVDFTVNTTINMRVFSPGPGLQVKFKLEGDIGDFPSEPATERDATTTATNEWEVLTWSFAGEPTETYRKLVLMFDFGNVGDGSESSTFYFDDIFQTDPTGGLNQIDLPITYEDDEVYYSLITFGDDNVEANIVETISGNYGRLIKSGAAATWAGVTLTNETGLENNIPVTSTNSKMYVHTYIQNTSNTGVPIRLKIENGNDPTQSVETEAFTTVTNGWEILEFDFNNEAAGTASLNESYPFNMVSIFFNFGSAGDDQTVYYFDNISFGSPIALSLEDQGLNNFKLYPNPVENYLNINPSNIIIKSIDVFNILGKKIFSTNSSERIDMSSYDSGVYFVKINNTITFKILKK